MQYLGAASKWQNDLFPRQTFNITVLQVYSPIPDAKEAEVDQFYEDPQELLELMAKKKSFSL